jgi:hypothetical protein
MCVCVPIHEHVCVQIYQATHIHEHVRVSQACESFWLTSYHIILYQTKTGRQADARACMYQSPKARTCTSVWVSQAYNCMPHHTHTHTHIHTYTHTHNSLNPQKPHFAYNVCVQSVCVQCVCTMRVCPTCVYNMCVYNVCVSHSSIAWLCLIVRNERERNRRERIKYCSRYFHSPCWHWDYIYIYIYIYIYHLLLSLVVVVSAHCVGVDRLLGLFVIVVLRIASGVYQSDVIWYNII